MYPYVFVSALGSYEMGRNKLSIIIIIIIKFQTHSDGSEEKRFTPLSELEPVDRTGHPFSPSGA